MSKLKCFDCNHRFKTKKEIFRNQDGYPKCEDCFREDLDHDWVDEMMDTIVEEVREIYNGSYNKWAKNFFEIHNACDGEHEDYDPMYFPKNQLTEVNGKKYCEMCMEEGVIGIYGRLKDLEVEK